MRTRTFQDKKMIDTFPGGQVVTDFESGIIHVNSGNYSKSLPLMGMTLKDHEQLIRKTELESKPASELTVKEFDELNLLTMEYETNHL